MQMTFIDAKRNPNALAITLSRNVLREKNDIYYFSYSIDKVECHLCIWFWRKDEIINLQNESNVNDWNACALSESGPSSEFHLLDVTERQMTGAERSVLALYKMIVMLILTQTKLSSLNKCSDDNSLTNPTLPGLLHLISLK